MLRALTLGLAALLPVSVLANPYADNLSARLVQGWQQGDGSHIVGLELTLKDGWKTYWRAPGDAGVPPIFSWSGSSNVARVDVIWPKPEVFFQNGMRSIGYSDRVILPLHVQPAQGGAVELDGQLQIGICSDICVPLGVDLSALPLPETSRRNAAIVAALAERPFTARQGRVRNVSCDVAPAGKKMRLRAQIELPSTGGNEVVVFEPRDPSIWVSESVTKRQGNRLIAEVDMMAMTGGAMMLDREALRLTVLGDASAVEINGCPAR
ncbi:protein-disulfide reductase DsbD domain-containing protein [Pseudooceanicola sp. MF1-13]|uniref:protein-disulfide reductase DsbD domain-containing protein n=1 Tax=Pseudooceanicola sp. MF1-13 TaxID=3379095 RepID=UPI00389264DD